MKQRIITGILIIISVLPPLFYGGIPLRILIFAICAVASYEIVHLRSKTTDWPLTIFTFISILAMYNVDNYYYVPMLSIYVIVLFAIMITSNSFDIDSLSYMLLISLILTIACKGAVNIQELGTLSVLYIAIACYGTDAFAYFTGVKFGKHKMIPRISPNKTWEGAIGGYVAGLILSLIFGLSLLNFEALPSHLIIFLSITLPIIAQLGDLSFSAIKRHYKLKDFGTIFPGHGGVLDRIDSLLFCIIYTYAVLIIYLGPANTFLF